MVHHQRERLYSLAAHVQGAQKTVLQRDVGEVVPGGVATGLVRCWFMAPARYRHAGNLTFPRQKRPQRLIAFQGGGKILVHKPSSIRPDNHVSSRHMPVPGIFNNGVHT